jgi:hypothetical protein
MSKKIYACFAYSHLLPAGITRKNRCSFSATGSTMRRVSSADCV